MYISYDMHTGQFSQNNPVSWQVTFVEDVEVANNFISYGSLAATSKQYTYSLLSSFHAPRLAFL